MEEIIFLLCPLPGATWINNDPAFGRTEVSFADEAAKLLRSDPEAAPPVVACIRVNGVEVRHRALGPTLVEIRPALLLQGEWLQIVCQQPKRRTEAPFHPTHTNPAPNLGYGLQRAVDVPTRHPR